MHIEDGYELPLRVTFEEPDGECWQLRVAALPQVGHTVIIGPAPKGVTHTVSQIVHRIGGASHSILITVVRTPQ